jgi:hypothetical protein
VLGATVVDVVAGAIALALILNQRAPSARRPEPWPTAEQRYVTDQLVAVYENTETTPQYGYIEDHHDGCGYTAGWVGFCTATGDLLEVVDRFTALAAD